MADDDPPKKYVLPLRFASSPYGTRNLPARLVERYTQMQTRIAELEQALAELPAPPAPPTLSSGGMGHNNPPERLEIESFDIQEIKQALQELKAQLPSPPDKGAEALRVVEKIEAKTSKLREWVERRAEEFTSEAAKAAGKQTGTWLTGGFVIWLVDQLLGLTKLAQAWIDAVQ